MIELQDIHDKSKDDQFRYEVGLITGFDSISIGNGTQNKQLNDPDNYTIKKESKIP